MSLTDVIAIPSVGLLIGAIGWWLKVEIADIKKSMKDKVDTNLCKVREDRILERLKSGDDVFKQVIAALNSHEAVMIRLKESIDDMHEQSQESDRLIGEALVVVCQAVNGNGACERVEELLKKISESRLNGNK